MTLRAYLELVRLPNSILSGLGALFSILVYSGYSANPLVLSIGFITGFLLTGASMVVNDVVDLEVDKVNKPWKPLPRGDASVQSSLVLAVVMVAVALALNTYLGTPALLVSVVYCALGISYSFMRKYWWSHVLVATSTTGPVVYGYVVTGAPRRDLYFTTVFTAVVVAVNLGREFLKALQDYEGDLAKGYKTIATRLGVEKALRAMLVTGVVGSALALYTLALSVSLAYKALIAVAAALYAYSVLAAYKHSSRREVLENSRKKTLIAMFIGTVAFWLSKLG